MNVSKETCGYSPTLKPFQEYSPTCGELEFKSKLQLNDRTQFTAFSHMVALAYISDGLLDPTFNMGTVDTRGKENHDLKMF